MHAHKLKVTVSDDHRLSLDLPEDFPAGPAEVSVLAGSGQSRTVVRMAGALSPDTSLPAGDSIAQALEEMREERAAKLDRLMAGLESDADG